MQRVTDNVFVETGYRGCNPGFVVTSEGIVMIDTPQEVSKAEAWAKEIARWGKVRYIVNTEPHLDHTLCDSLFEGTVVAHQSIRDSLLATDLNQARELMKQFQTDPMPIPPEHRLKVPSITFSDRVTLWLGGHTFHLMNLPGHTTGETAVYIPEEKVVFTGDNVFGHIQTFLHEALPYQWLDSLNTLEGLEVRFILPGHGDVVDKRYLREQAFIVRGWVEAVKKAKAAGLDIETALAKGYYFQDRHPLPRGLNPAVNVPLLNMTRLYAVVEA